MIQEYQKIQMEEILPLYAAVGWTNYTDAPDMLQSALEHSLRIYADYEDGRLTGLVRAVGDGHSILYIQDILVYPAYQRRGIGRALLQRVLEDYRHVYQTVLLTEDSPSTSAFYEGMGFVPSRSRGCISFLKQR